MTDQMPSDRDSRTHAIIGAAMGVHSILGRGFLEPVYQDALAVEMRLRGVPFEREVRLSVTYKGIVLNASYRSDFVCFGNVIVEVKALPRLTSVEDSQLLNYLKSTGFEIGLLLNFGSDSLEFKRKILTRSPKF